ncbi:hypothetical protein HD806DRAFT_507986 [Xylariaceae sp. AK1471]|nr:hypothetical protein HD806DRAFT_507986 [Xylariaceae sp. AK1471]
MAATTYQTFPATWTPASSCLASTAYYQAVFSHYTGIDGSESQSYVNMFGNPTPSHYAPPSGPCLPPSYTPKVPSATDGPCPTGYTAVYAVDSVYNGLPANSVACCPSGAFSFSYLDNVYGCRAHYTAGEGLTGWSTDLARIPPTGRPITYTASEEGGIVAWAIRLLSIPTSSSAIRSSTTSIVIATTTPSNFGSSNPTVIIPTTSAANAPTIPSNPEGASASHSSGLSTGAKAGIGVGGGVGVLLLLFANALILRRRRVKLVSQQNNNYPESVVVSPLGPWEYKPPTNPSELYSNNAHVRNSTPVELAD